MLLEYITIFLLPFLLCMGITPYIIKLAFKVGAVDKPDERKVHQRIMPRFGGVAVYVSLIISFIVLLLLYPDLLSSSGFSYSQLSMVAISVHLIFFLGVRDDLQPLKPGLKFGFQFLAATLVYLAGFKISNITNPLGAGIIGVEILDFPLTLLWIVGVTNAFNLIDGLDGLAAGIATIACFSIFGVSLIEGEHLIAILVLALAGTLMGFLRYNFNPAKIFLGDCGSLLIGFLLALFSIGSSTKITTGFSILFPFLVLGLPITDTIIAMIRRFLGSYLPSKIYEKEIRNSLFKKIRGMFTPDKSHIHHQLISKGFSHRNTVILLYAVSIFFALNALLLSQISSTQQTIGILLTSLLILFLGIKRLRYREMEIFQNGIMIPLYERLVLNNVIYLYLLDICFVVSSFLLTKYFTSGIAPSFLQSTAIGDNLIIVCSVQMLTLWMSGLHNITVKQMSIGDALKIAQLVLTAVMFSGIVFLVMGVFSPTRSILFLLLDFYFLLSLMLGIRIAYRALNYWFARDKKDGKNVLIYGANNNGVLALNRIINSLDLNMKVVGFLDDNSELKNKYMSGYQILGSHWELERILRTVEIDYIFICDDKLKTENLLRLKSIANRNGIVLKKLHINVNDISNLKNKTPQSKPILEMI